MVVVSLVYLVDGHRHPCALVLRGGRAGVAGQGTEPLERLV
jgi:hypothetical protein